MRRASARPASSCQAHSAPAVRGRSEVPGRCAPDRYRPASAAAARAASLHRNARFLPTVPDASGSSRPPPTESKSTSTRPTDAPPHSDRPQDAAAIRDRESVAPPADAWQRANDAEAQRRKDLGEKNSLGLDAALRQNPVLRELSRSARARRSPLRLSDRAPTPGTRNGRAGMRRAG